VQFDAPQDCSEVFYQNIDEERMSPKSQSKPEILDFNLEKLQESVVDFMSQF
jgi:hypothetical protein